MKVSVISLIDSYNFGSLLQAFATQEKINNFASSIEIIHYTRPNNTIKNKIYKYFGIGLFRGLAYLPTAFLWHRNSAKFIKLNLNTSKSQYSTEESFKNFPLHDGFYCTGSDQVWNTDYNQGVASPLYLNFVPSDKKKFSYAASFGKESLSEDEVNNSNKFIKQYKHISVRENSAREILEKQFGRGDAVQIVDPTLAMPPEFWRNFAPKTKNKSDYILIYNLNFNKTFDKYALDLSKKTGLQLIRLCHSVAQAFGCGKSIIIPEIFSFITLIDNARYVLTDSFHGTAFSMNLNTEPIVVYPEKFSTRLSSLLQLLDAEHRAITNFNDFDVLNRPTDFDHINKVLARERERVDEFLKDVFSCNGGEHS